MSIAPTVNLWKKKSGDILVAPDGMRWIVLDNSEVPEAYWGMHSSAWMLPTTIPPWQNSYGDYENYAANMGSAHKGSAGQVLIPEYYTTGPALPAEWGEVCY